MDSVITFTGTLVVGVGGGLLAFAIICSAGLLASIAWVAFSDSFRSICKAESLIHEYRKNRKEFMAWKAKKDGAENGE